MDATIDAVRVAGTTEGPVPVVLLAVEDENEDDVLPIYVGFDEAASIARGQDATDIGRPLTHDLLLDVVEELGGRVTKVVVSAIEEGNGGGTYIADLHIRTPRDDVVVDARPSDSLALAARTNAAIEVSDPVFEDGCQDQARFEDLQDIREVTELA